MGLWAEGNYSTSKLVSFKLHDLYKLGLQQQLRLGINGSGKVNYVARKCNQNTSVHISVEVFHSHQTQKITSTQLRNKQI